MEINFIKQGRLWQNLVGWAIFMCYGSHRVMACSALHTQEHARGNWQRLLLALFWAATLDRIWCIKVSANSQLEATMAALLEHRYTNRAPGTGVCIRIYD